MAHSLILLSRSHLVVLPFPAASILRSTRNSSEAVREFKQSFCSRGVRREQGDVQDGHYFEAKSRASSWMVVSSSFDIRMASQQRSRGHRCNRDSVTRMYVYPEFHSFAPKYRARIPIMLYCDVNMARPLKCQVRCAKHSQ